jgi:hypothetical protein
MEYSENGNSFSSWEDVQREYAMSEEEPHEIFMMNYTYECYEGWSIVVYRRGHKYYTVHGSHCSCYGLEDQWDPEEYESKELLIAALEKSYWTPDGLIEKLK